MTLYVKQFKQVLKTNFMLLLMAFMLLAITFFIWLSIPIFLVGTMLANVTTNVVILHVGMALLSGVLFSLYFIPFNLKLAHYVALEKRENKLLTFFQIQLIYIIISASLFEIIVLTAF